MNKPTKMKYTKINEHGVFDFDITEYTVALELYIEYLELQIESSI